MGCHKKNVISTDKSVFDVTVDIEMSANFKHVIRLFTVERKRKYAFDQL